MTSHPAASILPVSYTHLDVYKRQLYNKTKPNRELCELRNMIAVAYLVIKQGREIKESVGCHFNADYPKEN